MPVCRVAPDLGVRRVAIVISASPKPAVARMVIAAKDASLFHVTNDTNVTVDTIVTIEAKVANGTSTELRSAAHHFSASLASERRASVPRRCAAPALVVDCRRCRAPNRRKH